MCHLLKCIFNCLIEPKDGQSNKKADCYSDSDYFLDRRMTYHVIRDEFGGSYDCHREYEYWNWGQRE